MKQMELEQLAKQILEADAVVVGIGSGMSSAAGYNHYHWTPAMEEYLADFKEHYRFSSPFAGFYHCYSSYEEQWAFYARYLFAMHDLPTGQPYLDLAEILKGKDYFILTSNVDMQCERVFPTDRICDFQGNAGYLQCSQPCHDEIYENREQIETLSRSISNLRVPVDLVPRCSVCGRVMVPWLRDDTFLEGKAWKDGVSRYQQFLRRYLIDQPEKKVLLLELGVGEMTLSVIKLPFWDMTAKNPQVFYACLNRNDSSAPAHLKGRSLYWQGDLTEQMSALRNMIQERKNEQ